MTGTMLHGGLTVYKIFRAIFLLAKFFCNFELLSREFVAQT